MPCLKLVTSIAAPRERCFDLARSIDLHAHSAARTEERAVGGRTSGLLAEGEEVTWRARHFGIIQTLTVRMTACDRPRHFHDSMIRGAFARMEHDHHFDDDGRGGTVMRDDFEFAAPFGIIGKIVERLVLTGDMRRFLDERNRVLKATAESEEWRRFVS